MKARQIFQAAFVMAVACAAAWCGDRTSGRKSVQDWPVFRGNPLQTGVAGSSVPEKLKVIWTFKAKDAIESTAAIVDGMVYVSSLGEQLYALDLASGAEKWSYKTAPMKAPPGVNGSAVFVGDLDGNFHCLDARTGKVRWTFATMAEISSGVNFTSDSVLFGSGDEHIYALTRDGKEKWKFKVPGGPVLGTPVVAGNRTFGAGCDSSLHVIDINKGTEAGTPVDLGGQVGATAAVAGDVIYVGNMSNQVLAINWKTSEVIWRFETPGRQAFYSSPAVTDSLVVIGCRDRRVYALKRTDGQKVWDFQTDKKVDASPVVAGQRVLIGSFDGNFYVLDLSTGKEIQRLRLGGEIVGSAAVAENRIVIGTSEGTVYCLGKDG